MHRGLQPAIARWERETDIDLQDSPSTARLRLSALTVQPLNHSTVPFPEIHHIVLILRGTGQESHPIPSSGRHCSSPPTLSRSIHSTNWEAEIDICQARGLCKEQMAIYQLHDCIIVTRLALLSPFLAFCPAVLGRAFMVH